MLTDDGSTLPQDVLDQWHWLILVAYQVIFAESKKIHLNKLKKDTEDVRLYIVLNACLFSRLTKFHREENV